MSIEIRSFTPEDYAIACDIANAADPDEAADPEDWRHSDAHQEPRCRRSRWIARWEGEPAGYAAYFQEAALFHPRKFWLALAVRPEFQGRGIGGALYETVLRGLEPLDPLLLHGWARADRERSVGFLVRRGFAEVLREWESRLDVASFDPAPFACCEEALRAHGIQIRTLVELADDPDRDRKLWELEDAVESDVPSSDPHTQVSFEHQVERRRTHPRFLPEGWLVAVHEGRYVGLTNVWGAALEGVLDTGLTGVRREYRRKGIGLALKLRAIRFARERGYREIRTWNETGNAGMLAINQRLGFARQPAWIDFVKSFEDAAPDAIEKGQPTSR